jgi:hypothetical protein
MELQRKLDALVELAGQIGLEIRREPLGGEGGGYCVVRGRRVLFIDTTADLPTCYDRTAAAIARLGEIEQRYLPPEIREDIERYRSGEQSPA